MLLCVFARLSWSAVQTKNATIDEPIQTLSGWLAMRQADFRLVPESPSLWECYAALPDLGQHLNIHPEGKVFSERSFDSQGGINWTSQTLYHTPGNDGEALVRRARMMMLPLGMLLGALIGYWSYQLSGPAAAIIAVALFSFDANFLAHAPIVKSDVPLALLLLVLAYSIWRLGKRFSWARAIFIGAVCGIAINTKFSGFLLLPILAVLLFIRAMLPIPWEHGTGHVQSRPGRLLVAAITVLISVAMSICVIWAAYGFRFRPATPLSARMDMPAIRARAVLLEAGSSTSQPHVPTDAELTAWRPGLVVRCVDFADAHHLLPQAMLGGFLYQYACLQLWPSYLLGRLYGIGPWYYFPLAMLWKTPLATLIVFALMTMVFARRLIAEQSMLARSPKAISKTALWSIACIVTPLAMFGLAALRSHLQIGIRSILPLYPFLFIASGVALSTLVRRRRRWSSALVILLIAATASETVSAWPNFISFFNATAGGPRAGFALLGDSNLDWGQDLKELARWQKQHPTVPIYLHYCGATDPAFLGIRCHDVEATADTSQLISDVPMPPGVLAVSTNYLQGLLDSKTNSAFFRRLAQHPPDEVVGTSIYLYRYPLRGER
jgi:hypothetical protein